MVLDTPQSHGYTDPSQVFPVIPAPVYEAAFQYTPASTSNTGLWPLSFKLIIIFLHHSPLSTDISCQLSQFRVGART